MGVAVDKHIDSGGMGNNGFRGILRRASFISQMAYSHHIIRTLSLCRVYSGLNGCVEQFTVRTLAEAVDEVSVFILEIGGRRLGQAFRSGDSHIGNLYAVIVQNLVRGQYGSARSEIQEVAAEIGVIGPLLRKLKEILSSVVKFMISGYGDVIPELIHDVHQKCAVAQSADGAALDCVSCVNQRDAVRAVLSFHFRLIGGKTRVADGIVDAAVHIVGVQNDDRLRICRFVRNSRRGKSRSRHGYGKDEAKQQAGQFPFFHVNKNLQSPGISHSMPYVFGSAPGYKFNFILEK